MANCARCGRWAGMGKASHDGSCDLVPPPLTEAERFLFELKPMLHDAATRAGVVAALIILGVGFCVGVALAALGALR